MYPSKKLLLSLWNKGANKTKADDEKGDCLEEEVEVVMVLPEGQVVAATEEEIGSCEELQ